MLATGLGSQPSFCIPAGMSKTHRIPALGERQVAYWHLEEDMQGHTSGLRKQPEKHITDLRTAERMPESIYLQDRTEGVDVLGARRVGTKISADGKTPGSQVFHHNQHHTTAHSWKTTLRFMWLVVSPVVSQIRLVVDTLFQQVQACLSKGASSREGKSVLVHSSERCSWSGARA